MVFPSRRVGYDQIARVTKSGGTSLLQGLTHGQRAGSFDFIPPVFRGLSRNELFWRISDHYPLWCEFLLP